MLNFPIPYPEELIYSTVARAGIREGIVSPKELLDDVYGNRNVIATLSRRRRDGAATTSQERREVVATLSITTFW